MEFFKKLFKFSKPLNNDPLFLWHNTTPFNMEQHEKNLKKNNIVRTSRYNLWNFIPLNFFEQFQKLANFYFLVLVIILFALGSKSPVSPITTILPLAFVVLITSIKQGYEDYQRHKADNEINNRLVYILEGNEFVEKHSSDIKLGNILKVCDGEEFPCDMILLSSSFGDCKCYITTANFDGETNLKIRFCCLEDIELNDDDQLAAFACTLEIEPPNCDLYRFTGRISAKQANCEIQEKPLNSQNYLLRGARLRNTAYVYGITIFTGEDTKLAMNLKDKRRKVSIVDKKLNKFVFAFIGILVVGSVIVTGLHYTVGRQYNAWYLQDSFQDISSTTVFIDIFTFLSLLNYLIPISLYVTIELQKFANSAFISWDLEMYHSPSDEPAHSNTSDIIEELGQIQYIFSDKTGTLTENQMVFQKCVIGNRHFEKHETHLDEQRGSCITSEMMDAEMTTFFIYMCLCHTAEAEKIKNPNDSSVTYKYTASSPDEVALLEASAMFGIVYRGKVHNTISISVKNNIIYDRYKILHVFAFDAVRRRMSVIVQDAGGHYIMICKGAESHVLPLCNNNVLRELIQKSVDDYAQTGLRTLCFAYKNISPEDYEEIHTAISKAEIDMIDREIKLRGVYEGIEVNLIAFGATAVEDKLQEEVYATFFALREAGIKLWVLTGDKEETAVSISFTCGHLSPDMDILYLCKRAENIALLMEEYAKRFTTYPTHKFALVLDGQSLKSIILLYKNELLNIFKHTHTVLCCRMSPLQKSQIVHFMRINFGKIITLAVGDGANDCSMIQEAHAGIGIMGREGRQAVYSSDYAIHRFKYLKKLLLFHGYNFYIRITTTIHFFFYKNMLLVSGMYIYIFFTKYSSASLFSDAQLTIFNALVTALPILGYGIFEQHYTVTTLLNNPQIYKSVSNNELMSWIRLLLWSLNGVWQGLVIFFFCYFMYDGGSINVPYQHMSVDTFGTMVFTYIVVCATLQIGFLTRFWNIFSLIFLVVSLLLYCICEAFTTMLYTFGPNDPTFSENFASYYTFFTMLQFPQFWMGLVFIIPFAFLPYFICVLIDQRSTEKILDLCKDFYCFAGQPTVIPRILSDIKEFNTA